MAEHGFYTTTWKNIKIDKEFIVPIHNKQNELNKKSRATYLEFLVFKVRKSEKNI